VRYPLLIALSLLGPGCADGTDPGDGSGTLVALVEASGRPDRTSVEVSLRAGDSPVAGANVVFTDVEREREVTAEMKGAGEYRATFPGYARTLRVRIVEGDDFLEGQLRGPAPHVITRPPNDAIVRRGQFTDLRVEWAADDPADRVEVDLDGLDRVELEGDPFTLDLPLAEVKDGEQDLSIRRETEVALEGGRPGSRMRARYEVDNRFTVER
jgi:hypothetical protein